MLSNYFLCAAGSQIDASSKFFKVSVPATKQGERDSRFLQDYAARHNYYWHSWDTETAEFYAQIAQSLGFAVYQMPTKRITARCLVAFIKESNDLPKCTEVGREAAHLRKLIEPSYHFARQLRVIQAAEAEQRNKPKSKVIEPFDWKPEFQTALSCRGK